MLKGIPPLLTPDLPHARAGMGQGDRIAIVLTGERRFCGNVLLAKGVIPP